MSLPLRTLLLCALLPSCIAHTTITARDTVQPILLGPTRALPGEPSARSRAVTPTDAHPAFTLRTSGESQGPGGYSSGSAIVDFQVHATKASPVAQFIADDVTCHGWTSAIIVVPISLAACEIEGHIEEQGSLTGAPEIP